METFVPKRLSRTSLFILAMGTAAAAQFLLLRAAIRSMSHPSGDEPDEPHQAPASPAAVVNDGLVWITPKPDRARRAGYEDDWLMDWKRGHYSPNDRPHCAVSEETPYDDEMLCTIPGYVPARLHDPAEDARHPIPRVIFVTWLDRRLGRAMYTSIMTLLHHNPEYELVFFDDDDVDRFLCEAPSLRDGLSVPTFSRVRAGAMRSDIWRLLVLRRYGGVYLDSDISALDRLPIGRGDTAVSGIGGWSHLPSETGGVLEHWAMAFAPRHPFVRAAVEAMTKNLEDPRYLMREDTPEAEAEESVTMRLTGPAMYQHTLHRILEKARCRKVDNSHVVALLSPEDHCEDMTTLLSYFPEGRQFFPRINLNRTVSHKVFVPSKAWERETEFMGNIDYDDEEVAMKEEADLAFCALESFEARAERRREFWKRKVEEIGTSADAD